MVNTNNFDEMVNTNNFNEMANTKNYDGYSSDTTNQRLKDGEKIPKGQKYH